MAMGELFTSPHVIDFIRCRVSQVGGITAVRKIAALCEEFGVRTAWQEGGDNDPVNQLAAWHVDMLSPRVMPFRPASSYQALPNAPFLGRA
jgi:mannonate dehydratase